MILNNEFLIQVIIENNSKIINLIFGIIIISCLFYIRYLNYLLKLFKPVDISMNKNKSFNENFLQMCYKSRSLAYGKLRHLNESNLITIQDKLKYLMIHESPDFKSKIVDKILLRNYSAKKLGIDICVPIIKIYNNPEEIKLEDLPDKFVIKSNHGYRMNILCNNKSSFQLDKAKFYLRKWININFGVISNQFQYINIEPKIFSEVYLKDNIEDYKIYCFHGVPKFIRVQKNIEGLDGKVNNYYDLNWKLTDIETGIPKFYRRPDIKFKKPNNFSLMIKYAKKLSEDFVFVRVDLYNIDGKIYLGEMTFSPSNLGFKLKNRQQSIKLGKLIHLDKINKNLIN